MSSSIWTRCGARANLRRLGGRAWRVVEGQHVVATRKLVDSLDEQAILERLIESSKPPLRPEARKAPPLHYLLATPFRYPPLRHGSRFGTRAEPSLWYGSTRPRSAFAETAYYRLLFLDGTTATLEPLSAELSLFRVPLRTSRGVDLTREPFTRFRERIASPTDYEATQQLGREMRDDGVEAFRYPSARDVRGGTNVALFTRAAFAAPRPDEPEAWHMVTSRERVELTKRDFFKPRALVFPRSDFEVDGRLPAPAV
jgi:hypothetical protein